MPSYNYLLIMIYAKNDDKRAPLLNIQDPFLFSCDLNNVEI